MTAGTEDLTSDTDRSGVRLVTFSDCQDPAG
jgi:hypothetical protein